MKFKQLIKLYESEQAGPYVRTNSDLSTPTTTYYKYPNYTQRHRLDGPAYISGGYRAWYKDGLRHREDGPAIEYTSGAGEWYLHGKQLSPKEIEEQEQKIALDKQIASDENNPIGDIWSTL